MNETVVELKRSCNMRQDNAEIVPYLVDWFSYNARILAWRENPNPYYIWVSEIMLQQTRVEAVKGYFDRFITQLPTIQDLAEASEETILKLWEGLGYYNRVRNMQKAAKVVVDQYGGELPADYDKLLALPGIGTYTAGAIASSAYQIAVPAIDGNVLRVMKRIQGSFDDITKEKVKKELWLELMEITPKERPGDFNQSLMELGAIVCLPNGRPLCEKCPVMHLCNAFKQNTWSQIPVKPPKKARKLEEKTVLLIELDGKFAIRKREEKGLLAGLWELPTVEGYMEREKLENYLATLNITAESIHPLGKAKHIFTHIEWHMLGYYIRINQLTGDYSEYDHSWIWASKDEINEIYTIPNAFQAYTKLWKDS